MEQSRRTNNSLWSARRRMGFSQERVARALGLRKTSVVSRYENGKRYPSLVNALKLEIVYRMPVAFLFRDLYSELKDEVRGREEHIGYQEEK